MYTLAFMRIFTPLHMVPAFVLLVLVAAAIGIFFLGRATAGSSRAGGGFSPTDADMERRRRALELDRMAIENEERRRKLGQ